MASFWPDFFMLDLGVRGMLSPEVATETINISWSHHTYELDQARQEADKGHHFLWCHLTARNASNADHEL